MIGSRLGPYELREELGQGGMATVYLAYQPSMDRRVAVKVIRRSLSHDASGVERFQREARLIARLEHPHILPVYDFDGGHEPPYIVMRYLPGGTLKDILKKSSPDAETGALLPFNDIVHLTRQIASALDYAHRQGIIHRDVKPSNVIVDSDGNAFLTDFGIARMAGQGDLTQSGTTMGTPAYMSPEQAMGQRDVGPRADIYSLGVVVFELLSGQLPYEADSPMALALKHIQEPVQTVVGRNTTLPLDVDDVLMQAMAKKPDERFATASEFTSALAEVLGIGSAHTPTGLQTVLRAPSLRTTKIITTPVIRDETPSEQHKVVTAVYADASEYAALIEEADGTEAARKATNALWDRVGQAVEQSAGRVMERRDNGLVALWGMGAAGEDDPERAVRAALAMQATLRELGAGQFEESTDEPLPLKIGVNTGMALLTRMAPPLSSPPRAGGTDGGRTPTGTEGSLTASGATLTLAQRLAENAEGVILISHETLRSVLGIFTIQADTPLRVRGRKEPIPTYRVLGAKPRAFRTALREVEGVETKMVGREAELKQLQNAFLYALEESETQIVTIVSEAGLGKSRLLAEFDLWAELRPETFFGFRGRATPAMTQRPYALLRDMLSYRFEILDSDPAAAVLQKMEDGVTKLIGEEHPEGPRREMAHFVGHLAGFDFPDSPYLKGLRGDPQQLATRAKQLTLRLFALAAPVSPIVVRLEDLHWADSASLDLLNDLVTEQQNIPFLLIGLARPMLFERRPTWGSGQSFHKRITLEPLDKRESRELAREILQKVADAPKELRDLLVERAEGNPFYMEELVKMLIEDRVVVKGDNKWTAEPSRLAHVRVPTTLVGLLQARLDTLLYPEKLALQRAAVMGRVFYDGALRALDAHDETTLRDLDGILKNLTERGFVYRRETSAFAGNVEYIFSQAMLREAVYETLLRRQLRAYHAGVAEWLGKASGERRGEYLPLIAEHYEKADENEKAAAALREAGDRALILSAFADAKGFFERALTLSEAEKGPRAEVAELECKLGEAHHRLSDFATAQSHTETALTFARQLNSDILVATALAQLGALASDLGDYARVETYLTEALPLARAGDDPETLARVLYGLGDLNWRRGGFDAAHSYLNESLTIARATGNTTRELYALNRMAAVTINQNELGEAERLLKEVHTLALAAGNRERAMTALNNLGVVADIRGDFAAVYDYAQQALALARELGAPQNIALYLINLGEVSIKRGDRGAARKQLREGLSLAQQLGARPTAVSAVMYFARLAATEHDTPRALALLGMTQRDPSFTADNRRNLEQMLAEWALDPAVVEAGLAKGAELSWDEVIKELLKEDVTRSY